MFNANVYAVVEHSPKHSSYICINDVAGHRGPVFPVALFVKPNGASACQKLTDYHDQMTSLITVPVDRATFPLLLSAVLEAYGSSKAQFPGEENYFCITAFDKGRLRHLKIGDQGMLNIISVLRSRPLPPKVASALDNLDFRIRASLR